MKSTKPSRYLYKKLISKRGEEPISSQQRWQQDIDTDQRSTGRQFTSWPLTAQRAQNLLFLILNFYIDDYQPTVSYIN